VIVPVTPATSTYLELSVSTAIRYSCPATATNVRRLAKTPIAALLLARTRLSAPTAEPRYTARSVSSRVPDASNETAPFAGATHRNQIDAPPSRLA
jgi:hypothetical protein